MKEGPHQGEEGVPEDRWVNWGDIVVELSHLSRGSGIVHYEIKSVASKPINSTLKLSQWRKVAESLKLNSTFGSNICIFMYVV